MSDTEVRDKLMLSHSQIGVWNTCRTKWWLNYEQKLVPKEDKPYFATGTMVHKGLAIYYDLVKAGEIELGDEAPVMEFVKSLLLSSDVNYEIVNKVGWLLRRYVRDFSRFEDKGLKILEVEKHFVMDLVTPRGRDYSLQGYVDLVVEEAGRIWLWDHKTSGSSKFWTETEILMDSQMPTYSALLRRHGLDVFGVKFNFLNTYDYKDKEATSPDKLFKRASTYRTPPELDSIEYEFGLAVDDMIDNQHNIRRSLSKTNCGKCQYQQICLLTMKGIPLADVAEGSFKIKGQEEYQDHVVTESDFDYAGF